MSGECVTGLQLTRPILDSPKSVSLMWPSDVMSRLDERWERDREGDREGGREGEK